MSGPGIESRVLFPSTSCAGFSLSPNKVEVWGSFVLEEAKTNGTDGTREWWSQLVFFSGRKEDCTPCSIPTRLLLCLPVHSVHGERVALSAFRGGSRQPQVYSCQDQPSSPHRRPLALMLTLCFGSGKYALAHKRCSMNRPTAGSGDRLIVSPAASLPGNSLTGRFYTGDAEPCRDAADAEGTSSHLLLARDAHPG
jgi:hypothetical protein